MWMKETAPKVTKNKIKLTRKNDWIYLSKFGLSLVKQQNEDGSTFNRGSGEYTIRAKYTKPYKRDGEMEVNLILDTEWEQANDYETDCNRRNMQNVKNNTVKFPANGEWGEMLIRHMNVNRRHFVWFLVASDCGHKLHATDRKMPPVEVEIHWSGVDGTEFSHEEIGLSFIYSLLVVGCLLLCLVSGFKYYAETRKTEKIDSPLMILCIAVLMESVSIALQWIHLSVYGDNGEGVPTFDILSIMLEVASQFALTLLFILIARGWTITYTNFGNIDVYVPLVILLFLVHLIIAGLTYITNDANYKYHDFEGVQGLLLVLIRIAMYVYFLISFKETLTKCMPKAKLFMTRFSIWATLYLLAFPILVVVALVCAHYVRHKVVTIGNLVTQIVAMLFLIVLLTSKNEYFKISKRSESILPGRGNH